MNKTDRLLAIVLKLQSSGELRAEDLAKFFETSKRTIYRDLQALSEAGVPLIAIPGRGYSLVEGYFLPPLSFSSEEAVMLLLGGEFVAQNFDAHYQTVARSATLKIEGVLPEKIRSEVQELQNSIRFITIPATDNPTLLKELRRAVIESRTITFKYYGRVREQEENPALIDRRVDPYGLVYYEGAWYLIAHDHARQSLRNFRLDRIEKLKLLTNTFIRPADFNLQQIRSREDRQIIVRVRFDKTIARQVKESRNFYIADLQEDEAGLLVTLRTRQETDVVGWLLSWGRHAEVLEPTTLIERLLEETLAISQKYKNLLP